MRVGFGFSNVTFRPSRVFHFRVFSHPSAETDEQSTGSCPRVVTNSSCWQCLCTLLYFATLYVVITVHAVKIYHCTIRFINEISKEVPYETFSISFHFYKIVHENTFALTPPCFIWVSRAIAKHARSVLTAFCQCSNFVVNGITEI